MAKARPDYKQYVEGMLECCVCLDTVRDPHTLQGCFHSVCESCLDQLLRKEDIGVTCPLCRTFSMKDNIRANYFVRGLAEMHVLHKEKRVCEQCPARVEPGEACSKCLDCKMNLCSHCRDAHLNIRILQGHRILPLTEATELIVDQLVFCAHHPDKPIELYCQPCHKPVCMMCTVTGHRGHECLTIEATLDQLVPQWEKNIQYIEERLEQVDKSSKDVEKQIAQTKSNFQHCENQIDKKAEERIAQIRASQKQMKDGMKTKEKEEIEKLEKMKRDLAEKKRDGENVKRVVRTSLDRARHASLMTELLQEGLEQKMESVKEWEEVEEWIKVDVPKLEGSEKAMDASMKEGLLGKVLYSTGGFMLTLGSIRTRVWNLDAEVYFSRKFRLLKQIQVPKTNQCVRITPIHNHIWLPSLKSNNSIEIYDKDLTFIKAIQVKCPVSVAQASNGDIFIACKEQSGLYITNGIDRPPDLITTGDFTDVYCYNGKMYALNHGENKILEYVCKKDEHSSLKLKWSLEKSISVKTVNTYDTLIIHQSGFYVSSRVKKIIYHYSETGQCLSEFKASLVNPYLCGIDKFSNIIVADQKFLYTIECKTDKAIALKQFDKVDVIDFFVDVRLYTDGSLWVLHRNAADDKECISKYEVVNG